ncbi:histidine triad nucleotide-binding protein [Photobacterium alginatilyticum]|uniref:Histidine triad nucleotide-binding protein n=2 Tax=Photobacterium alginatilyticum TaxID=1775171 RepID=A0ABW9YBJ0_9GAMM|nr:histidine triad nucleotide-binding protein [Photobacterium alginatilyticum]
MMDCIFCKIASKEIPSTLLYEDEQIVAFHDNAPQAPTHILIIPHLHIATINDLEKQHSALIGHMILTATQLAKDLSLAEDGYRLVWNCNRQGGQAVYHIHLHLLGGRNMHWPPG